MNASPTREDGYTLIELLISTVVLTLLLAGLYSVLFQSQATFEAQQDAMYLRQQARVGINQMITELRMTGFDVGSVSDSLPTASSTSVTFVADIDDGDPLPPCDSSYEDATDGGAERITYTLDTGDGTLERDVACWDGSSWTAEFSDQVMARNVLTSQALFRYYDADGNELVDGGGGLTGSQRQQVRSIEITLEIEDTSQVEVVGEDTHPTFSITTRARLRNVDS